MFSLVAAKSIRRIENIKGKAVAVSNPLGIHAYVTLQILKKFGLDPEPAPRFVSPGEGPLSWVSAMETGLVSAAFIQPPTSLVLKQKGYNILVNFRRPHRITRHRIVGISRGATRRIRKK